MKQKLLRLAPVLAGLVMIACLPVTYTSVQENSVGVLPTHQRLVISNLNGYVQLEGRDDSLVSLSMTRRVSGTDLDECKARVDDITITIDSTIGDDIRVTVAIPTEPGYSYGVDMTVKVPYSLAPDISTTNGQITASDLTEPVKATTSNGTIALTRILADVDAHTSNGKVELVDISGSVDAVTSNNAVEAEVTLPDSNGHCRVTNSNGAIRLEIPDSTSAWIYASTSNSVIHVTNLEIEYTRNTNTLIEGRVGGGLNDIRLTTSNAQVNLVGKE